MRVRTLLGCLIMTGLIGSGAVVFPEDVRAADVKRPPLSMEELEVRGIREKPDTLYLPVSRGIRHEAPVRFDLLKEDMTSPVLPWEIDIRNSRGGRKY